MATALLTYEIRATRTPLLDVHWRRDREAADQTRLIVYPLARVFHGRGNSYSFCSAYPIGGTARCTWITPYLVIYLYFLHIIRVFFSCLFPSPMPMRGVVPLVHSVYSHSSSRRLVGKGHSSLHYMVIIPDSCLRVTGPTFHLVSGRSRQPSLLGMAGTTALCIRRFSDLHHIYI